MSDKNDLDLDLFLDPDIEKLFTSSHDEGFLSDETIFSSKSVLSLKSQNSLNAPIALNEKKLYISGLLDLKFDPACLEQEFELFVKSNDKEVIATTGHIFEFDIFEQNKLFDDIKKENVSGCISSGSGGISSGGGGSGGGSGGSGGSSGSGSSGGDSSGGSIGGIIIGSVGTGDESISTISTIKLDLMDDITIKSKLSTVKECKKAKQQYNKEKRTLEKELEKYNIYIKTEHAQIKHYNTWVCYYFDKLQLRKTQVLNLITLSSKQIKIEDDAEKYEIKQLNYYTNMRDKHIKMQNDYIIICSKIEQQLKELIDLHELKELHNISCSETINETPCPKRVCI